jgi:hypothetical protein
MARGVNHQKVSIEGNDAYSLRDGNFGKSFKSDTYLVGDSLEGKSAKEHVNNRRTRKGKET